MPKPPKPTSDWTCREILDAKAINPGGKSRCEFCGTRLRWIHILQHDEWHRPVEAGCCCAARLCFDYDAAAAERSAKNKFGRMTRFVAPHKWNPSKANPANVWRWVNLSDGQRVRVTIFLKDGKYGIYFADKKNNEDNYCPPGRYGSREEAKVVAFELIENT